jgi:hypothetical protein
MAASFPSIVAVVSLAYSDARRILRAMTMLVIFAVLIRLAIKVAEDLFPRHVWGGPLGSGCALNSAGVGGFNTGNADGIWRSCVDSRHPDARRLDRRDCPIGTADHFVSGACGKCPRDECALHWLTAKVMSSRRTTCAQRVLRGLASDLPDAGVAMRLASILEARSTLSYLKRVRHRHGGSNDATGSARPRRPLGPNVRA